MQIARAQGTPNYFSPYEKIQTGFTGLTAYSGNSSVNSMEGIYLVNLVNSVQCFYKKSPGLHRAHRGYRVRI